MFQFHAVLKKKKKKENTLIVHGNYIELLWYERKKSMKPTIFTLNIDTEVPEQPSGRLCIVFSLSVCVCVCVCVRVCVHVCVC